jgi:hypothetical protein
MGCQKNSNPIEEQSRKKTTLYNWPDSVIQTGVSMGVFKTFKTTNWVLVSKANSTSEEDRLDALGHLFHEYAPALTEFLERFYRLNTEQASDCVQDFGSDRILAGNLLKKYTSIP